MVSRILPPAAAATTPATVRLGAPARSDGRIPVTLLVGPSAVLAPLLAGLLAAPGHDADTALVVDAAALAAGTGPDHPVREAAARDADTPAPGCACCLARSGLGLALDRLFLRRVRGRVTAFRRVVVALGAEADPARALQAVMAEPLSVARYRLAGLVAVFDVVAGAALLAADPLARKRAAMADRLLIAGAAGAAADVAATLAAELAALNPAAPLRVAGTDGIAAGWLLGETDGCPPPRPVRPRFAAEAVPAPADAILSASVTLAGPLPDAAAAGRMLAALCAALGEGMLRLSGLVATADDPARPLALLAVQHRHHPPERLASWPGADAAAGAPRAVLHAILRGLPPERLRAALARHVALAPPGGADPSA